MAGRNKYRLKCQTINKQNKLPCKAKGIYCPTTKTVRCRIHGGASFGARTLEGKVKAYKNLIQFKNRNDEEIRTYIRDFQRHSVKADGRHSSHNHLQSQRFAKSKPSL